MTEIKNDPNTEIDLTKYLFPRFIEALSESEKERHRERYRKREEEEKVQALKKQTQMAALKSTLTQTLLPEDLGEEMLKHQLTALGSLFDHTVKCYSESDESDTSGTQLTRLNLAMRLQNQSMTTAMTLSKMVYMDKISSNTRLAPTPTPLIINDEQTKLGENDR